MTNSKKIFMSILLTASLAMPAFSANADTISNDTEEKIRVYVEASDTPTKSAIKGNFKVRWELTENGFSTEMTEKQFIALKKNKNAVIT